MLINFRVSNFLSFNYEVEFSLLKGKSQQPSSHVISFGEGRTAVSVLKFGVLYGANASGKSNFVKALDFARNVIVDGLKNTHFMPSHFRLDSTAKDRISRFEFEFYGKEGKAYAYGFEVILSTKQVKSEWLFELKKTTDRAVFEREVKDDGTSEITAAISLPKEEQIRFDVYAHDVAPNELLLTTIGTKNWNIEPTFFESVYKWFDIQLKIIYPSSKFQVFSLEDEDVPKFCDHLKRFNTGIVDLKFHDEKANELLEKLPIELKFRILKDLEKGLHPIFSFKGVKLLFAKNENGEIIARQLMTKHQSKDESAAQFSLEEESDGTQRLFDLIPLLQLMVDENVTVVIDEIDRSLHPEMSRNLIETVAGLSDGVPNQLIVTTHESSLLDLKLLRRDEIWFVEKNEKGESKLYSLEEFKPRFDKELRKAYLQGRFGAIPFISNPKSLGWGTQKTGTQYAEG